MKAKKGQKTVTIKWRIRSGIGGHELKFTYPASFTPDSQITIWRDNMGIWVTEKMFISFGAIHSFEWEEIDGQVTNENSLK